MNNGEPYKWGESVSDYIHRLDRFFGVDIYSEYDKLISEIEHDKMVRGKFNGKLVMSEFPELKGSELGDQMKSFKDSNFSWDSYVNVMSKEDIMSDFKEHYLSQDRER